RRHAARCSKLADVHVGDADMTDLPLTLEIDERSYGVIERHARIRAMQLIEINPVNAETLEARLAGGAQMTWPSVWTPRAGAGPCEAALGRNDQPIRMGARASAISSSLTPGP